MRPLTCAIGCLLWEHSVVQLLCEFDSSRRETPGAVACVRPQQRAEAAVLSAG